MAQEVEVKIKVATDQAVNDINKVSESFVSLKTQLRNAQNEVTALSEKFGATSREAIEAAKRAGELKDKIGDAKALTDAFNPDAKFNALSSSLTGVAGGFSVLTGAMGAFGANTKEVEEQLLKVQSAMAISSGLQSVGESVDSFKQLGAVIKSTSLVQGIYNFVQTGSLTITKANTVATEAQAVATTASAVATSTATSGMKLFRLALIGTGIGAIVVALGLLIANFDKVKETVLRVIPGLKAVGEFIGNVVDSITDFVGATSDATRALDKLKANAENTLAVNKKFMQEHGDQVDAYTKKKIDAKNAYAEAVKEDGADQVALAKRLNRELAEIEFSRGDEKRKIQKDANEKASANKKADNEKVKKEAEDEAKKLKDEKDKAIISEAEAFRNQLEAAQKVEADAKKANADALLTEQELAIQNENLAYETKKANAIKFGTDYQEIERQHLNTLNDINLTAQQKQYAEDKANSDAKIQIAKLEAQAKMDALDSYGNALGSISGMLGESTAAGKAAAIASTTISTYSSATKAYESQLAIPTPDAPVRASIAAGVAIAGGLMNVKKILSVKTPKGGGGGAGGGGGISAPAPAQFNVVGAQGSNQIAQTLAGGQQQPIQAYVVAGAVTTGQSLNRNIINNASMG